MNTGATSRGSSRRGILRWRNFWLALGAGVLLAFVLYTVRMVYYVADPQDTVVLGQSALYADSPASFRVLVRNYVTGRPVGNAAVRFCLAGKSGRFNLGSFKTGADGTFAGTAHVPDVEPGDYELALETRSRVGADRITQQVAIKVPARLYLTTDKPIYQPGQTLHARAMALNRMTLKPLGGTPVTLEVEDPKGNKVFRATQPASAYGIVSADFDIASEVNLGRYKVRAAAGGVESEKVVTVSRYVLPKFKVAVVTQQPYYLPGETVAGRVSASYFFGKPVAGAAVELTAATMAEQPTRVFAAAGRSDEKGEFSFEGKLPALLVGLPLSGGNADLEIVAKVTDVAGGHSETSAAHFTVAPEHICVQALPESGEPVPGVENLIYIVTGYPDGRPAACSIEVNGQKAATDSAGVAVVKLTPLDDLVLTIRATDAAGRSGTLERTFKVPADREALLLRTDKAVYSGGETVNVTILSAARNATYFVDVIKDRQTVLTKSLDAENGRGTLAMDLPPSLFGTFKLSAYTITEKGESVATCRVIYVRQPGELRISTRADRAEYKPGETATVRFEVTDKSGKPMPAALGLSVVDEAVFHVGENRPGLLEQFFTADEELLAPRYQTKFSAPPSALLDGRTENRALALAAFAAASGPKSRQLNLDALVPEYLSPELVEEIKLMDPAILGRALEDPRFARVAALLRAPTDYTLRTATYLPKKQRAERYREEYFSTLKSLLIILIVAGIALAPLIVSLVRAVGIAMAQRKKCLDPTQAAVHRAAHGLVYSFSVVSYFPLATCLGLLLTGPWILDIGNPAVVLRAFLTLNLAVTAAVVVYQLWLGMKLRAARITRSFGSSVVWLSSLFTLFYAAAAGLIAGAIYDVIDEKYGYLLGIVLGLGTLIAFSAVARQVADYALSRYRLRPPEYIYGAADQLGTIAILLILIGMFLPALGRARDEARGARARSDLHQLDAALAMHDQLHGQSAEQEGAAPSKPRVRKDFPETLLWRPELITDDQGRATLSIPLADSITTWQMSADALSASGLLGSMSTGITVFQDFFIDLDLPVALTQHDEVSIPVACYNYLKQPQTVRVAIEGGRWCEVLGESAKTVTLGPNEVGSVQFRLKALEPGTHELTVTAQGEKMSDAMTRRIEVRPDGTEVEIVYSDTLDREAERSFTIPADAIPGAYRLLLKVYPSTFSEVVEGLDSIFRMPYGCFEQTSSCTYPNAMALAYMKKAGKATPEVEVKARKFITAGYQRLLTFEVAGGGFSLFGSPPAVVHLTAYGILEFTDMAKVHAVDAAVIERTQKWLFSQQSSAGNWGDVMATAYVAWALAESGTRNAQLDNALTWLGARAETADAGNYVAALAANALLARDSGDPAGMRLASQLAARFQREKGLAWLGSEGRSAMYSRGYCLDVETTALATLALLKCKQNPQLAKDALTWLSRQRDPYGTWRSTQATILAMKALLAGTGEPLGGGAAREITVALNGAPAGRINIAPENSDVLQVVSLTKFVKPGENVVRVATQDAAGLPYQIAGSYWVPYKAVPVEPKRELEIQVSYDRTRLAVGETIACNVEVRKNGTGAAPMAIIDLGIPPGFSVDPSAFESMVAAGSLAKYEVTGNQCILYVLAIEPAKPLRFSYELRAKYPVRAKVPPARVYEYYNPENEARAPSHEITAE